jgi:predicted  nucleic acid-binding Zn-ribbon protein
MSLSPEQFNKLVTKDEFNELKSEVSEINEKINSMITALDGIAKIVLDIKDEFASNIGAHDRFEASIDSHESRIKTLETTKQIA